MNHRPTPPTCPAHGLALAGALAMAMSASQPASATAISEVFLDSPAGQAIELGLVDDTQGATLVILDGSRFGGFATVLDIIQLQPNQGWSPTVLLSENPWPGGSVPTTSAPTLNFGQSFHDRLLVVFDGTPDIQVSDKPLTDPLAAGRYDAAAVTDWLAFGGPGLASAYDGNYSDIELAAINAALGIDLLARTADRSAGDVFARTNEPGHPLDPDTTFVGTPDANGRFDVGNGLTYRTTPGLANVPLVETIPEPGTAAGLVIGGLMLSRRRRRVV